MINDEAPEFSRPVRVGDVESGEIGLEIEADAEERAALAARFGLTALDSLWARLRVIPEADGTVRLEGEIRARVTQSCVVTLAPVRSLIEAEFSRLYRREGGVAEPALIDIPADAEDPVEPLTSGALDAGEAVAEQLSLELDPFPRAPDAAFEGFASAPEAAGGNGGETANGPFAALARLKKTRG